MGAKQKAFIEKLKEIFQINNSLDFGIYRVINERKEKIEEYIDNTLPEKIDKFLENLKTVSVDNATEIKRLEEEILSFQKLGDNEAALRQIEVNKNAIALLQKSSLSGNIEEEIYDKLLTFFSRYYDDGDFISQRRYKDGVYALPYSGEEVKLHWANRDQYYIKTGENFKDYTFNIEDDFKEDDFNVSFILTDAEIERDNNKSDDKKIYVLAEPSEDFPKPIYVVENENKIQMLFVRLSYKYGKDIKQKDSSKIILNEVKQLENDNEISSDIKAKIGNLFKLINDKVSYIEYHLNKYIAKNSFDFFIHKDLKKFLMQELDFYIKNEVIYLQDLYGSVDNSNNLEMNVRKAGVIHNIGSEIITFLSQLEDFQKELYLKKKFVTETNYCITLDKIDKKYYDEIILNKAQIEEWKKLFAIDEIKGNIHTSGYTEPLKKEFLEENKYLVLDTCFFSEEFKERIIADIDNLDENIDGLLIHGDNFQALNLMQEKYKEQVQCVYIDPPYNTKNRDFNYKDNYKHSSWLAMMSDRLDKMKPLMNEKGVFFSSIDDNELSNLRLLCDEIFLGEQNFVANLVWTNKEGGGSSDSKCFRIKHEYILTYTKNLTMLKIAGLPVEDIERYREEDEYVNTRGRYQLIKLDSASLGYISSLDFPIKAPDNSLIYPNKNSNKISRWRWSIDKVEWGIKNNFIVIKKDRNNEWAVYSKQYINCDNEGNIVPRVLQPLAVIDKYSTTQSNKELNKLMQKNIFSYSKPVLLINFLTKISSYYNDIILDFFAGSGTTGHAVINLNREDGGKRKYILVEMGEYFDTVTKPRIQKVIYSSDWKDGKPVSREGSSHIFKYIRLESYEDTLNNVEFSKSKSLTIDDYLQTELITKYKTKTEAEDSLIYLPVEAFYKPFDFKLKIVRKNESKVQKIDLIETFNFLIGLKVYTIYTKKYNAEFKNIDTGRLYADIKLDDNGQYIFKIVEGFTLKGEKVLVIWRNIVGNIKNNDDLNKNNAVLESVTLKNQIKPSESEYDIIYINCTNSLQNFAKEGTYKVALIEEVMKDKMFRSI